MDILPPKPVVMSDETILWFEFLLKPSLLTKHLNKPFPDPSPTDLINQFLAIVPENQNQNEIVTPDADGNSKLEGPKYTKKQMALKILALKVASFIRWDLELLEKSLSLQRQIQLLSDLCTIAAGKTVNLPLSLVHECPTAGPDGAKHSLKFALTLYHRWVLRALINRGSVIKVVKPIIHGPNATDPNPYALRDETLLNSLEPFTQISIDFLNQIIADEEAYRVLSYESFVPLDSNFEGMQQNFELAHTITKHELNAQLYYDLCVYYMYIQKYELAKQSILLCKANYGALKQEYAARSIPMKYFIYCCVNDELLQAYLLACGVTGEPDGLLQRLHESVNNHYSDIVGILKEDNVRREIPMTQRKILELNIEGYNAIGSTDANPADQKELELAVVALNMLRYAVDSENILGSNIALQKYKLQQLKLIELMFQYADEQCDQFSLADRELLRQYFFKTISLLPDVSAVQDTVKMYSKIITPQQLDELKCQRLNDDVQLTGIATQTDWVISDSKNPRLEVGQLERQLISCTSANAVRKLLVKIAGTNPTKPLWSINPSWSIPHAVKPLLVALQRGFLQDFAFILLGKAKEMATKKDYAAAINLLTVLKNETQRPELSNNPLVIKLGKIVSWEGLLVQVQQVLDEWPKKPADQPQFLRNCKQCLNAINNPDIVPRTEVLEYCAAILLNFNDWNAVMQPDKRGQGVDLSAAVAQAYLDIEKFKGTKKTSREAWDLVLPMFVTQQGSRQRHQPESPVVLHQFLGKLRDPLVISIVLSLLTKLHNILKDETNLDMNSEYLFLWPTNVNNPSLYNLKLVSEALNLLLNQGLSYYPNNIPWIKLKGDLEFLTGNHEAAMRYYVTSLVSGSEYCSVHMQRPLIDEFVIRRMVKCSSNLGCFMQAVVLCQFLDETDYALAFKSVGEKSASFADAMDSYYGCMWDPTLLEYIINWHSKKGEHKRRQQAIYFISQLELNSNNNEEIKRESAAIRKTRFLRSLAKQYML